MCTLLRKDNGENNAYKVRFPLSQHENYTFLIDVNFDKILKRTKEKPVLSNEKEGVSLDFELWHRGVIYYSETDIDTNNFNPELLTVTQHYGADGEI